MLIICAVWLTNGADTYYRNRPYYDYYNPRWTNENRWIRIPQPRRTETSDSSRHFGPDALTAISETLGAINTVGRYIINMTRGGEDPNLPEDVPGAIYTISKNVLGRNVTDTISPLVSPLVRESLPNIIPSTTTETTESYSRTCTTPEGASG